MLKHCKSTGLNKHAQTCFKKKQVVTDAHIYPRGKNKATVDYFVVPATVDHLINAFAGSCDIVAARQLLKALRICPKCMSPFWICFHFFFFTFTVVFSALNEPNVLMAGKSDAVRLTSFAKDLQHIHILCLKYILRGT